MKIFERLRTALEKSQMKPADLARATGFATNTISQYLNGQREPDIEKIAILAKALNVSAAELAGLSDREQAGIVIRASSVAATALTETAENRQILFDKLSRHSIELREALMQSRLWINRADDAYALLQMAIAESQGSPVSSAREKANRIAEKVAEQVRGKHAGRKGDRSSPPAGKPGDEDGRRPRNTPENSTS